MIDPNKSTFAPTAGRVKIHANFSETISSMLVDPTVFFCWFCLLSPIFLICKCEWGATIKYVTTPYLWVSFAYFAFVMWYTHFFNGKTKILSASEHRVANWFLMNGVYFTLFLDVFSGQFQRMDAMTTAYNKVECRYVHGLEGDTPGTVDAGITVFMTSMLEFFFQSPLALVAYYGIHHKRPYRHCVIIVVCVLQVVGCWYYYVGELLCDFRHCDGWPKDLAEALTFERLFFFWFGFFVLGLGVWIVVPYRIARQSWREVSKAFFEIDARELKKLV